MNTKMMVIIECPKGSQAKYKYNEEKKDFEIDKILPLGMVFPYDFGFIPDTVGEDKDPLDAMVFSEFPLQTAQDGIGGIIFEGDIGKALFPFKRSEEPQRFGELPLGANAKHQFGSPPRVLARWIGSLYRVMVVGNPGFSGKVPLPGVKADLFGGAQFVVIEIT